MAAPQPPPASAALEEDNFQLVWHNHQTNFHEVVGELLVSEAFADVSLVSEGCVVRAHRLVLSACSPFLHALLSAAPCAAPHAHPVLLLPPEVSLATLRTLLAFMYHGVVHVPHAALVAVLHAGDILKVRGLCREEDPPAPPVREAPRAASPPAPAPHPQRPATPLVAESRVKEEPFDWSLEQVVAHHLAEPEPPPTPKPPLHPHAHYNKDKTKASEGEEGEEEPTPLECEQCHQVFPHAAQWVRHLEIHPPVAEPARPAKPQQQQLVLPKRPAPAPPQPPHHQQPPSGRLKLLPKKLRRPEGAAAGGGGEGAAARVRRPHSCYSCGKRFSSRASLCIHSRTHTGETPFRCDLCEKGFNVKSNLMRHLRTLHNRILTPSPTCMDAAAS